MKKLLFIILILATLLPISSFADSGSCSDPSGAYNATLAYKADFRLNINGIIEPRQLFYSVYDISNNSNPVNIINKKEITSNTVDITWDIVSQFTVNYQQQNFDKVYKVIVYGAKYRGNINLAIPVYLEIHNHNVQKCLSADFWHAGAEPLYTTFNYSESAAYHPSLSSFNIDTPSLPANGNATCHFGINPGQTDHCYPDLSGGYYFNNIVTYNFSATIASNLGSFIDPIAIPSQVTTNEINVKF